jgi:TRAP-type mannitol/chloroaromatic compound transport system permease small subunit
LQLSQYLEKVVIFFGKAGSWLAFPLIFIIIFDIITRRFFILGSTKLQEMEWHLHTALFLLTLGFAYIKNSHVRIEIVREKYSTLTKSIFEIIGIILFLIPYTYIIIYYGFDFVSRSFNLNEVSSALTGLSHRWIIKAFIPLGLFILLLAGLSILLRNIIFLISHITKNTEMSNSIVKISPELKRNTVEK